ncbi:hypothetical protein ACFWPH_23665 [Nocardia sp. NPDC058499]|uniref:hypothetical protein n=1 Tax=Nocardia sp. NPDC058499 TaxID=3346530 RepID=UPI003649B99E
MFKLFSTALLTATAAAALQALPAAPAHAMSPGCAKAIELINIAVDTSGGTMDAATSQALSDRLLGVAELAVGAEKDAIAGYARALVDDSVTDLTPATDQLNRACV